MKKRVFFLLVAALLMPWAMKAQVNSSVHIDSTLSKCDSYTWSVTGDTYTSDTVVTHAIGDTLYILDLTIRHNDTTVITEPIHGGCTFQWGSNTYTEDGTYTQTFTSMYGCDSTVTLTLILATSASVTYDVTACDSYTFEGQTYTTSGTYNVEDTTDAQCDSLLTLNLTILPIEQKTFDTIVVACESTEWMWSTSVAPIVVSENGRVITSEAYSQTNAATRRIFHPRTAEKCFDSLVTVTFNIKRNQVYTHTARACDDYTFFFSVPNSDTTTVDTVLYYTFSKIDTVKFAKLASNGCDTVLVTNITINPRPVVTISGDLRVAPHSNCTRRVSSDLSNTTFTWHDGSHDTVFHKNNVTENFDVFVTGLSSNGCEHTSYVTVLVNEGIDQADSDAISIYPNPTSGVININSNEAVKNIAVFNINGQQMINAEGVNSIDLSVLAKGTYVVRVDLEDGKVVTRTIVVNK